MCHSEKCGILKHASDWHRANFVISQPHIKCKVLKNLCKDTISKAKLLHLFVCFSIMNIWAVAASRGGMGEFPPSWRLSPPPLAPQSEDKNGQNQPFSANFWVFAPSESHFAPSMPPTKKILVPPLCMGLLQIQ